MSFIECMKSELDLFKPRNVQTSILKTEEICYKPLTSLDNQSVIEFACQGHGDTYLDLSSINLRLKIQVAKSDGTTYKTTDLNQPEITNNVLSSLFRQVNVSLNGKSVNSSDGNYSYRAYIETLLNYGGDANCTHLETVGWNKNYKLRNSMYVNSAIVELYGKLHADMLNQPLLLLNNVNLRISLTLNKPEFYLITTAANKATDNSFIKIIEAGLHINHCTINPQILIAHHRTLERSNAKYHYKRCEIKSFIVGKGNSISLDNIVLGQLPTSLIFLMVDNDAYTGCKDKDPFNFKHNSINSFALYLNGTPIPNESISTDFNSGMQYARAYSSIFTTLGLIHTSQGNLITKDDFKNGSFIIACDLTPDLSGMDSSSSLLNQGNIRIEARFDKALERTVTCLVFLEYDSTLEIDKNRNIILDH